MFMTGMKFVDTDGYLKYSDREEQAQFTEARKIWRKQRMEELLKDPIKFQENEFYLKNDLEAYGPC